MAVRRQDFHEDEDDDMGDNAKKRTRITIDVSPEMRRRIKMAALQILRQEREKRTRHLMGEELGDE